MESRRILYPVVEQHDCFPTHHANESVGVYTSLSLFLNALFVPESSHSLRCYKSREDTHLVARNCRELILLVFDSLRQEGERRLNLVGEKILDLLSF